jgi:hypothetical protein
MSGKRGFACKVAHTDIENNDITNANNSDVLTRGGIGLQDSSLGGSALPTVDMSNFITTLSMGWRSLILV